MNPSFFGKKISIDDIKNNSTPNTTKNCNCEFKKILTQNEAKKEEVGSFYHPTEKTYRTGACDEGYSLRKSYTKKGYIRKDGKKVNPIVVNEACILNKGLPGKVFDEYKVIKLDNKIELKKYGYKTSLSKYKRFDSLKKASNDYDYKPVMMKLIGLRALSKYSNPDKYKIYNEDIKKLKKLEKFINKKKS